MKRQRDHTLVSSFVNWSYSRREQRAFGEGLCDKELLFGHTDIVRHIHMVLCSQLAGVLERV